MPIKFKSLSYIYDEGMPYASSALDDINLELVEGKITAIIGTTGSGKSTLVEHLNALLLPSKGSLEVFDFNIEADKKNKNLKALRQEVGLVFQFSEYQLFEETILKDVAFGPKNYGFSQEEAIEKAKRALKLVGVSEDKYNASPFDVSGGQKRRIAIAGILALDPKMVVLDEPTAGLDPKGSEEIIQLFVNLNKKLNKTIIIVSHDNEMVYNYCDNTVLMSSGKVAYSGDTLGLFNNDKYIDDYHLIKPQLVELKKKLNENGFNVPRDVRTIEELAKYIKGEIRR